LSAFTQSGYRVASDEEQADFERQLCITCHGERRKAAHDEDTCLLVGYPLAGRVCKPCALFMWGDNLLRGEVPLEILEPEDRTLTHRELRLSEKAYWVLRGRQPGAAIKIVVEYLDAAMVNTGIPWHRQCGTCGRAMTESGCICRFCDCCSQHWISTRADHDDENGRPWEDCPECVGFVGEGVSVVIAAVVRT
jgi:hypothetical protein